MIHTVISGGQTGADQAALHAARACGLQTGGFAPRSYRTESGDALWLADFGLVALRARSYATRTTKNVEAADATVWFGTTHSAGFLATSHAAHGRRHFLINPQATALLPWTEALHVGTLNVAGNRESMHPGIFLHVLFTLMEAFDVRTS